MKTKATHSIYNPETDQIEEVDTELFDDWRAEAAAGDTVLGFMEWRRHQEEMVQDEREATN